REWLARRRGPSEAIAFSGVTDCYQPLEATYRLTRACLAACAEFRQPIGIVTKGALVERDADVLARLAAVRRAAVSVSVRLADDADARALEPFAALASRRLRARRVVSDAGIVTGVAVAPVIPGLNDHQIPTILAAARAAGATRAFMVLLRLPAEVRTVFQERLRAAFPERAAQVPSMLSALGDGHLQEARFGRRVLG